MNQLKRISDEHYRAAMNEHKVKEIAFFLLEHKYSLVGGGRWATAAESENARKETELIFESAVQKSPQIKDNPTANAYVSSEQMWRDVPMTDGGRVASYGQAYRLVTLVELLE